MKPVVRQWGLMGFSRIKSSGQGLTLRASAVEVTAWNLCQRTHCIESVHCAQGDGNVKVPELGGLRFGLKELVD